MVKPKRAQLTEQSIAKILTNLTIPMIFGMLGMVAFNLADTYFVGQLGTLELAAMTFTFPVVMVISSLALGLGMGASALISRAIGENDQHKVQRLTTDSLLLSVLLVAIFVLIGLLTIKPLFTALGASPDILPQIDEYMRVWYPGMIAVVVPMVGNNAIRATGDTKTPSLIMLISVFVNIIFDPLLIFGIGPFPRLGITGAALATVASRAITLCFALWILASRDKMLSLHLPPVKTILRSWKDVLYIGIPTAATNMLLPISAGIITKLIASYGAEPVAGFGVATRVEMFALALIFALATVLGPFVGQNLGAQKYDRVRVGVRYSQQFSLGWGVVTFLVLGLLGKPIASLFNPDPTVISTATTYFWIVPIGYGALGIIRLATITLNVLHKPLHSAVLILIQSFMLYVPLAYLGSYLIGLKGIFAAATVSYIIVAILAYYCVRTFIGVGKKNVKNTRMGEIA